MKKDKYDLTMREIGTLGGKKTLERHGLEFYQRIGKIGGQRVKRLIEDGYRDECEEKSRIQK